MWVPEGEQPIAQVNCVFSGYGCMVLFPQGRNVLWILPKEYQPVQSGIGRLAKHFGPGKNKQIILAMDQAGWHTSSQVVPEGIHLEFMPSHSRTSTSRASVASNQ